LDHAFAFDAFNTSNLMTIHKTFTQHITSDGKLAASAFVEALKVLGVTDEAIIERTFALFDVRHDGIIDYKEVVTALDVIINGTNKSITYHDCFAVFDPLGCGYILRTTLAEVKKGRLEKDGVNHMLVKTLIEIIDFLRVEDEEKWRKDWVKRHKRKRKKPDKKKSLFQKILSTGKNSHNNARDRSKSPASTKGAPTTKSRKGKEVPEQIQPKIHISYDEFCQQMTKNPTLVQGFLGRILLTMESVYLRNKRTAAERAGGTSVSFPAPSADKL